MDRYGICLRMRFYLCAFVAAILLPAGGCVLKTGVGDPAKSKVDESLVGYWLDEEHRQLLTVVAFDESTYLVDWMSWKGESTTMQPNLRVLSKAWVTELGNSKYVTVQMLIPDPPDVDQKYMVMQIQAEEKQIVSRMLDQDFAPFKEAQSTSELEKAIAANLDNAEAFSAPVTYTKTTKHATDMIRVFFRSAL